MLHVVVIVLLTIVALISLVRPWVGVVCAYGMVVLQPQAIWFWDFEGVRPEFWVLLPTGVGILLGLMRGQFDLSTLKTKKNLAFLVLWSCLALSYWFGPYTSVPGPYRFEDADAVFALSNKMMLLYFMATLAIDTHSKLKALFLTFCVSAIYLVYWGNNQYLSGHLMGQRLAGPTDVAGGGIYHDENAFSMLFVVAQPFLWYLGMSLKAPILRWGCWLVVPLCWHAVFLTGSRGGLVGLAVTTLLIALRSKKRWLSLALVPALVVLFVWQGGGLMKSRVGTIDAYQADASARGRLQAWQAASKMIVDHPLVGVGLASFGPAFPDYSTDKPREAHNTVFQITAESGILAGAMYIVIVITNLVSLGRLRRRTKLQGSPSGDFVSIIGEAAFVGFCGLVTCAMFLSLQVFEIFYLLNVFANAVVYLDREQRASQEALADSVLTGSALGSAAVGS